MTLATVADRILLPDDFKPVCQGATVSRATKYDQAAPPTGSFSWPPTCQVASASESLLKCRNLFNWHQNWSEH